MALQSDPEPLPLFDKITRVITGILAFALLIIAIAFFHVGVTYVVAFFVAFFAVKFRPVIPLYIAIATLPLLIGLSFIAKDGNAWDSLIQRVAAFVMFMILFGGYSMFISFLRGRFVHEQPARYVPATTSRYGYEEEYEQIDEQDPHDDEAPFEQQIIFEHQSEAVPVASKRTAPRKFMTAKPKPARKKAIVQTETPAPKPKAPVKKVVVPKAHHIDLSAMNNAKPKAPEPSLPVTKLAPIPKPVEKPVHLTKLTPVEKPVAKPTNVTDLRNIQPSKTPRKPRKLISG